MYGRGINKKNYAKFNYLYPILGTSDSIQFRMCYLDSVPISTIHVSASMEAYLLDSPETSPNHAIIG